jgi:hypothetical protein
MVRRIIIPHPRSHTKAHEAEEPGPSAGFVGEHSMVRRIIIPHPRSHTKAHEAEEPGPSAGFVDEHSMVRRIISGSHKTLCFVLLRVTSWTSLPMQI